MTVLQGDPFNLQGSVPNVQGGATAAVVQPAANPQQAAAGVAPRGSATVFYKPDPNSKTVYNTQGQALSYDQYVAQGGRPDFSNVLNSAIPGMAPAAPVSAPKQVQPGQPAARPSTPAVSGATFYKPDPNSQQVYNAQGQPLSYEQYIAQGGRPDFGNVTHGPLPGSSAPQPVTPTPAPAQEPAQPQGATPVPPTPPSLSPALNPNQERIDKLSKQVFNVTAPSQQKLYEQAYNAAGLATVRTKLDDLNKIIADKQTKYTSKEGDINENPFLSEASRVGRLKRLDDQKQAEIGNLLDEYKQYADLYNQGVDEVNGSVERQVADFNAQRQIGTEELNFLLGIDERDYDRTTATQKTAADFQKENNILSPFYKYPGSDTVYDTKTGESLTFEQYKARGGAGKAGAKFPDVQELSADEGTNLKDYPSSYQEYLLAKQDGFTGNYTDYQNADANRKARASGGGGGVGGLTPNQINSTVNQIAGAFDNEPIVKNYNVLAEGKAFADSISNETKNPADQQGLIYAFAKAMDPASVVREGEYATVQKYAQSWASTFGFNAARIFSNSPFLSSQAIANMKATINSKYTAAKQNYDNVYNEYQRQIQGAYTGQPRQITDYSKAFSGPTQGGASSVDLNDLF